MITINIDKETLNEAAEMLVGENPDYDEMPINIIAKIIGSRIKEIVEERLEEPDYFFKEDRTLWKRIEEAALQHEKATYHNEQAVAQAA